MDIDSFLPQIDNQDNQDKSSRMQISFPWADLVKTLKMDLDVQWIELSEWGITFCERLK